MFLKDKFEKKEHYIALLCVFVFPSQMIASNQGIAVREADGFLKFYS